MRYALLAALLALSGCAELLATTITDARDLHAVARGYVAETINDRVFIRNECRTSLALRLVSLRTRAQLAERNADYDTADYYHALADRLSIERYTPLATTSLVKQVLRKDADEALVLHTDVPHICGPYRSMPPTKPEPVIEPSGLLALY